MSFYRFRERLSEQMLKYNPADKNYKGEEKYRANTQLNKKKRKAKETAQPYVSKEQFKQEKRKGKKSRLCGDLTHIKHHYDSLTKNNSRICAYCGEMGATFKCNICHDGDGVFLHGPTERQGHGDCVFHWHDDLCFGLAKHDRLHLLHQKKSDYEKPTAAEKRENANIIKDIISSL